MIDVEVDQLQLDLLFKELEAYPKKVAAKAVRPSVRKNAAAMKQSIKGVVPTDHGDMKKALIVRATPRQFRGRDTIMSTVGFNEAARRGDKTGTSMYPALYAFFQHHGTSKMKANPFIKNWLDSNKNSYTNKVISDIISALKGIS